MLLISIGTYNLLIINFTQENQTRYQPPPRYPPPADFDPKWSEIFDTKESAEHEDLLEVGSNNHDYDLVDSDEGSGSNEENYQNSFDVTSGSKKFKVFLIELAKKPKIAANYCKSRNMQLLRLDGDDVKHQVFEKLEGIFGVGGGTALWIDGKYDEGKRKFTSWHGESGVESYRTFGNTDICLRIESPRGEDFKVSSAWCTFSYYFLCQKEVS